MRWWKPPLSGEPRCHALFLLPSFPLAVWSLLDRGGTQHGFAAPLARAQAAFPRVRGLAAVTLAVAGTCWLGMVLTVAYPARPLPGTNGDYGDVWGGPTLAGAWAVHALGGIASWLLVPWVLRGYPALWRRIAST